MRALVLLIGMTAACRYRFDAVGDAVDDANVDPPTELTIRVVGDGAIVAAGTACDRTCTVPRAGAVEVTAVAGVAWRFAGIGGAICANDTCLIAGEVADVTATFELAPITANIAFVSSVNAPLTAGLPTIDEFCQTRAASAGLVGNYVAMLATTGSTLATRLAGSRGWVRVDGLPIIDQPADLGTPSARAILLDETGAPYGGSVMTGSNTFGTPIGTRCNDWTTDTGQGDGGKADLAGTYVFGGSALTSCAARVYCFGTGKNVPIDLHPPPFPTGRYIFVSSTLYAAGGGIATADARCQSEATTAGLPGTYRAVLATTTQSVAVHLGSLAGRWRRPDGVVVSREALIQPLAASVSFDADGAFMNIGAYVLTGAPSLTSMSILLSQSCGDWTDPSLVGFYALPHSVIPHPGATCCSTCSGGAVLCAQL